MIDAIIKMLGVSKNSYWNYKKQSRPIISFLEKYFTAKELEEFMKTGNIRRLDENNISNKKLEMYENTLENHALYSAKYKINNFFKGRILIKDILIDVLNQMSENKNAYTLDNAKHSLVQQLQGSEINWLKTKTQAKIDLLSEFVENNMSDIEAYAMVRQPKFVLNLKTK